MLFRLFVLTFCVVLCSCNSVLDSTYLPDFYEDNLQQMGIDKVASNQDMFYINHVIARERSYLDYSVKGKSYAEILAMGKDMARNGMKVKSEFPKVEMPSNLNVVIKNEGSGYHENKKVLKFSANFQNTGSKDLALLDATFLVFGPFQDHIATTAYEINTKIKKGKQQKLFFLVDAKTMRENILFGRDFGLGRLFMDDIIVEADIQLGGASVTTKNLNNFNRLKAKEEYMVADKEFSYPRELTKGEWYEKDANGKATVLKPGLRHYPQ